MIKNPHDSLFRESFSDPEVLAEFLTLNLEPELVAAMDLEKMIPVDKSFVDEELKNSQADLVYQINFSGKSGYLYLLFEHQSSPDIMMPFRILKYMARIWDNFLKENPGSKKLPMILPILLAQCDSEWKLSTSFHDRIDWLDRIKKYVTQTLPDFDCRLSDVFKVDNGKIAKNTINYALQSFMKIARTGDLAKHQKEMADLFNILISKDKLKLIELLLRYSFATSETLEPKEFSAILAKEVDKETGEKIMSVAEQLFEKGRNEGVSEGFAQGEAEGEARGKAEGEIRGELKASQRALYKAYVKSFNIDPKVKNSISTIQNLNKLDHLLDLLFDRIEKSEFLKSLPTNILKTNKNKL